MTLWPPCEGRPPLGMLAFDCVARRGVLGEDRIQTEIGRLAAHAGGAPVAGFYTYGEIAQNPRDTWVPQPDPRRALDRLTVGAADEC